MPDMNLKLSADVNGFRTAMRNAQQAVKSLDAELKLNAAQMKAGGNEEQLMAERAELLRRQIAEQEKAIEAAGKALEALAKDGKENTTQFNQLRDAMTRNKTKLVEMQTDLKNIGNASQKAADDVKDLGDTLESINKNVSLDGVRKGLDGVAKSAESVFKSVANMGKAIWNFEVEAANGADDILTKSQQYGIDPETLQRMYNIENTQDIKVDDMLTAADYLFNNENATERAKQLGVNMNQSRIDALMETLALLDELEQQAIADGQSATEAQNAADVDAAVLFGNKKFRGLKNYNSEGYQAALAEAPFVEEEDLNKLVSFNDAVDKLNTAIDTFKKNVASEISEPMGKIADAFQKVIDKLNEWLQTPEAQTALDNLSTAVSDLFTSLLDQNFETLLNGAVGVITTLTKALNWMVDHQGFVITAIGVIGGAFTAFKATEGIVKISELVSGLKGLGSGGGIASGLGKLGVALTGLTITAAAVTLIASNAGNWMKNAYKNNPDSWLSPALKDMYKLLGYGDLETDALEEELKNHTYVSTGLYAYNPETGENCELTQEEVDAYKELKAASETIEESVKPQKSGPLPFDSYEEWLEANSDNKYTIPTGKKGKQTSVSAEEYYAYWMNEKGQAYAWSQIFGINPTAEDTFKIPAYADPTDGYTPSTKAWMQELPPKSDVEYEAAKRMAEIFSTAYEEYINPDSMDPQSRAFAASPAFMQNYMKFFAANPEFASFDASALPSSMSWEEWSDTGAEITASLTDGVEESLTTVEDAAYQAGLAVGGSFVQGASYAFGNIGLGSGATNNFNMGNVTFNNGTDIDGLAQKIAMRQFAARKGFGIGG